MDGATVWIKNEAWRELRADYVRTLTALILDPATPAAWIPGVTEVVERIRNGQL